MNKINIKVDRQQLGLVSLPDKTPSYTPVPHLEIINSIQEQLDKKNMIITSEDYRVARDGKQLIGYLGIESFDKEIGFMIGFKNSYDKSMSLGFASGGKVWLCSNGCVKGDIRLIRKHTGSVDKEIKEKIVNTIEHFETSLNSIISDREKLKLVDVSKRVQAELIGRLYLEEDLITSTQINIIKHELKFSENFKDSSAWSLYNHVTESLKVSPPTSYIEDHIKLHEFMTKEFSIV